MTGPLAAVRSALVDTLGAEPDEASVTFVGGPPIRVLRFPADHDGRVRYVSLGCSAAPMAGGDDLVRPADGPRAEVEVLVAGGRDGLVRPVAVLASAPELEGLVLTAGAVVDLGEELWPGAPFTAFVLIASGLGPVRLDGAEGAGEVTILRAVPVTATEAAFARARGVGALESAWDEASIDVADPERVRAL